MISFIYFFLFFIFLEISFIYLYNDYKEIVTTGRLKVGGGHRDQDQVPVLGQRMKKKRIIMLLYLLIFKPLHITFSHLKALVVSPFLSYFRFYSFFL